MFSTPSTARKLVTSVAAVAIAASALLAPQFTSPAAAATTTHSAASRMTAAKLHRYETNMINLLNRERHANGLRKITVNSKLVLSAHRHNLRMARANTMSHQLPNEAFFADRISKAGYNWMSAGENIGWNTDLRTQGIQSLEREMYNEKAPNNGHRLNILDKHFTQVGIDIYYDAAHHKIWFTQDFGQPMN